MKIALLANTDWYLYGYRQQLAYDIKKNGHQVVLLSPPGDYYQLLSERFLWRTVDFSRSGNYEFWSIYNLDPELEKPLKIDSDEDASLQNDSTAICIAL